MPKLLEDCQAKDSERAPWAPLSTPEEHLTTKDSAFHKKRPPKNMKTEMGRPRAKIFLGHTFRAFRPLFIKLSKSYIKLPSRSIVVCLWPRHPNSSETVRCARVAQYSFVTFLPIFCPSSENLFLSARILFPLMRQEIKLGRATASYSQPQLPQLAAAGCP